jgi:hypothetical protein
VAFCFGAGVKGEFQSSAANGFAAQFNYQRQTKASPDFADYADDFHANSKLYPCSSVFIYG